MVWILISAVIAVFAAVLLVRTAAFRPGQELRAERVPMDLDEKKIVDDLAAMIRCRTVSGDSADRAEFVRFHALLQERFPLLHGRYAPEHIGPTGLLFRLPGKSADRPVVLMAHYDVVPADETGWQKPPFGGTVEDGVIWGRGAIDTKGTLCGVLEAAEHLLARGFAPQQDLYLAFSGDEEIAGPSAPAIVAELERRGVRPALVVDEGGAVVEGVFPGVTRPCAVVGIAEKGMLGVELKLKGRGGHASSPPPHTPVGELSRAVVNIEKRPFPRDLSPAAAQMFDTLGRHSTFLYRLIFANLWCFMPVLDALCRKTGGELNAMMRTTCAFTQMKGSAASNVIPTEAMVGANLRLSGNETMDSAEMFLKKAAGNDRIELARTHGMDPSRISRTDDENWEKLKLAIVRTWPEALVSPYLMVACSDSRHYGRISDNVYRFSPMELSGEERAMIHGNDERLPSEKAVRVVEFYLNLMSAC